MLRNFRLTTAQLSFDAIKLEDGRDQLIPSAPNCSTMTNVVYLQFFVLVTIYPITPFASSVTVVIPLNKENPVVVHIILKLGLDSKKLTISPNDHSKLFQKGLSFNLSTTLPTI